MKWRKTNSGPLARIRKRKWYNSLIINLKNGRTPYHDLASVIPLAHPTISQHLKVLREIDLILVEEKVPKTFYEINHVTCQQYLQFLKTLVFELEEDLNPSIPASPEF